MSASHAGGSTSFSLAVTINEYIAAALSPPRSDLANSHAFLPRAIPRSPRSAALFVRQMRPSPRNRCECASKRFYVRSYEWSQAAHRGNHRRRTTGRCAPCRLRSHIIRGGDESVRPSGKCLRIAFDANGSQKS
jgi:hypothetical protein